MVKTYGSASVFYLPERYIYVIIAGPILAIIQQYLGNVVYIPETHK